MKGISSSVTKALNVGSYVTCADNTGAKIVQIISVKTYKGKRRRNPKAGVGDLVKVVVKKGDVKVRKQMFDAVIIRQKKEYRRANGMRISFEDNAVVIVNEEGEPKGTEIRGPVAREAVERFSAIGKVAAMVV
ncbi:MAG: 50S ribosomal protein L14 [Candidatus Aenigmarchaeota archaeon]|nr:50S ribosomal protein L14 [Candidatus Aenigmarchaeota archaeon]MCX8190618.1 50S ribosomal protein L14 [Candidatus Aenigmarchaeota archaeon]MDW8160161.1 50S ribosomal protein L14 [Candidatus Aenigmarchaeota archaeon]